MAKRSTREVYEQKASYWNEVRPTSLYEEPWLKRFISAVPTGSKLLDLGCGSGIPIAGYFLDRGFSLVGVDYSKTMIDLARANYPTAQWHVQDINQLAVGQDFGGIYSWDGFFHLSIDEQRAVIPTLCGMTANGGAIMLTVGTGEGEVTGTVGGETVYHASLSPDEYDRLFREYGFGNVSFVADDPHCQGRSVILASNKGQCEAPG